MPALNEALEKLVAWVQCDLLPLWCNQSSVMAEGWVAGSLDRRGEADISDPIFLSSQAQIAYVLARAEQVGWMTGNRIQVNKLIEFAGRHGTLPCRSDGYVHSLDRQFSILDEHHYLSDHALFMFASAAAYAAYGNGSDVRRAYNILDWLQLRLVHPHGGWFDGSDLRPLRSPRAHFHMLLVFLYFYEHSLKPKWLDAAEEILMLYQRKLLDSSCLRVYGEYQDDWTPTTTEIWYPEHQFLWIYGVQKFARCSGRKLTAADHYHSVCESGAVTPNGLFLERVGEGSDGEMSTAALAAAILAGVSLAAAGDQKVVSTLENHIHTFFSLCVLKNPKGLFIDRMSSAGEEESYTSAATTLILFDAARDAAKWLKASGVKP